MSELNQPIDDGDPGADAGDTELQFEEAEPTSPTSSGATCAACKRPIDDVYYEINGKIVCASCSQQIQAAFRGGSGLGRLIAASVFGLAAAVLGAAVYYGVVRATGLNIGYVAVFVGFLVGGAVRKGSGNRGGMFYQFLALGLSYLAIGLMTFAFMVEHVFNGGLNQRQQANVRPAPPEKGHPPGAAVPRPPVVAAEKPGAPKAAGVPGQAPTKDAAGAKTAEAAKKGPALAKEEKKPEDEEEEEDVPAKFGIPAALVAYAIFAGFVILAGPVLVATTNPISGLIYCFTLFQAWKMNKKAVLALNGPFQVSTPVLEETHDPEHDDGE